MEQEMELAFSEILADSIPMKLLLEADPSVDRIKAYLKSALCFAAQVNGRIIGACVAQPMGDEKIEIFNIAVYPEHQKQGVGSQLLEYTLNKLLKKNTEIIELGTGTFGYQLTFYQRFGFRADSIVKDFFLENYNEQIFENGIQHKDMLRLVLKLR